MTPAPYDWFFDDDLTRPEGTPRPAVCDLCQTAPDACLKPYGCVHTEAGE